MLSENKVIKSKLSIQLLELIKEDHFVYNMKKNEFVSKKGKVSFILNMILTKWTNYYSLSIRLYISHNIVEDIYENILGKSHRYTIGNTIERISKSPDGREIINGNMEILLFQDEDIDSAVETLNGYYHSIAKPYYEKYESLANLNGIINNPPYDFCPAHVGGNFDDRCIKGLIIAKLLNVPEFNHLVTIYDEAIKETMNDESIENYYKVREYLISGNG